LHEVQKFFFRFWNDWFNFSPSSLLISIHFYFSLKILLIAESYLLDYFSIHQSKQPLIYPTSHYFF
jgi:hypothetical protein